MRLVALWLIGSWPCATVTCLLPKISLRLASLPSGSRNAGTSTGSRLASVPRNDATDSEKEPDLFDYFDPLVSPHAYPNGISPTTKPLNAEDIPFNRKTGYSGNPFGIDYLSQKRRRTDNGDSSSSVSSTTTTTNESTRSGGDVLGFFDPLLSPHMYPNGVSVPPSNNYLNNRPDLQVDDRYNPLRMDTTIMSGSSSSSSSSPSPSSSKKKKKLGILLMDHGSRNAASNARLHHLAQLYQLTLGVTVTGTTTSTDPADMSSSSSQGGKQDCDIVVKAAHMEIATPTIPDGLKALLDLGVDEIICHPYFLSPGRHVTEDIPTIVNKAIDDLQIKVPVITTEPIGSNTQLMIGAIHSLVRENSNLLQNQKAR